jgi:hypothetical protein
MQVNMGLQVTLSLQQQARQHRILQHAPREIEKKQYMLKPFLLDDFEINTQW